MIEIFYLLLTYGFLIPTISNEKIKEEDGILILDVNNFERAISENDYIFVKFYAPWCKYSQGMASEYIKAANELNELKVPVQLAQIDASEEKNLCKKYDVFGFPTLKFFRRGSLLEYNGERNSDEIVPWLQNQVRPAVQEIETVQQAAKLILTEDMIIIGFFKDSSDSQYQKFVKIADSFENPIFAFTFNKECQNKYGNESYPITLYKNFDYHKATFEEELTLENMQEFVEIESSPLITELNHATAEKVFQGKIQTFLLLFISKTNANTADVLKLVLPFAQDYKKQIVFLSINIDEESNMDTLKYFKLSPDDVPTAVIVKNKDDASKYKLDKVLNVDNIKEFLINFNEKRLKRYLISEELSENWNKSDVYDLVGSNFVSVTSNIKTDVLVLFYRDRCKKCKEWFDIFSKTGEHYKERDDVIVAKINVDLNELEEEKIQSVPVIALYQKNNNDIVEYKGQPKFENIVQFLDTGGKQEDSIQEESLRKEEL